MLRIENFALECKFPDVNSTAAAAAATETVITILNDASNGNKMQRIFLLVKPN